MNSMVRELTDSNFAQQITRKSGVSVLDVWATWCAPCKALAPVIDEVSRHFGEGVLVAKLDADANPATVQALGVRGLPTVVVFVNGVEHARVAGSISKTRLVSMIEDAQEAA